jgi:sirohydrochlorin ferrochelatase
MPRFVIVGDLGAAQAQVDEIRHDCARVLGFDPDVRIAPLDNLPIEAGIQTFVIPAALDFSVIQRETLGRTVAEARREHPDAVIHHDDVDPGHPLVVGAFADQLGRAIQALGVPPQRCGLILAPSGHGDSASRAQSYRLARLLWEELGLAHAEVGFIRHAKPFLASVLEKCAKEPLAWLVLAQSQWETEHVQYARVMLENLKAWQAEAPAPLMVDPPGVHPMLTAWYAQRITRLWQEKRARDTVRVASPKHASTAPTIWKQGCGTIARVTDQTSMAAALATILPATPPARVLVKVTWHGYATGTYTDPAALDLLLGALPAPAIILEGHTTSRNLGGAQFDWETDARENRAWIRQQEAEYLRRTGLADVMVRHRAEYVNVTEAFWDEDSVGEAIHFVPKALLEFRGCPLISFAKFKGPTRLGISNLFGLIPQPLRDAWHGPNITWFARACCDVAKLYGSHFELCGVVEGLFSAVRWNRNGLYRSRWGNYDLIRDAGLVTASRGLVSADILASKLQGQDVARSAFFDVVRRELGWDAASADGALPGELETVLC